MTTRSRLRRARNLTAAAAIALLGLSACTSGGGDPDPSAEPAASETTQQAGTDPSDGGGSEEATNPEEPGGASDPEQTLSDDSGNAVPGSDAGRSIIVVHVVDEDLVQEQDGEARLPAAALATVLQDLGGVGETAPPPGADPAACDNDLRFVASADVHCTVTSTFDGQTWDLTMFAHPIATPGGGHGVLFTADEPMTEDARWATFNGHNETTAIGMGGAYGMDPIPADALVRDMQTVIDFDFVHEPVDTSQWTYTVNECAGDLDFDRLAPVRCVATDDTTGAEHAAWALPGTFYGQEPGLVVSIETSPQAD